MADSGADLMETLLQKVESALRQATPRPWRWGAGWDNLTRDDKYADLELRGAHRSILPIRVDHYEVIWDALKPPVLDFADRDLIANAPEWLAALVTEVRTLQARCAAAEQERKHEFANAQAILKKYDEALVEVDRAHAEVQRLREALQNIADGEESDALRKARAALVSPHPDQDRP